MREEVINRCDAVVSKKNMILCSNSKSIRLEVEKLYDINNKVFGINVKLIESYYDKSIFICNIEEISNNPALVEINVPDDIFLDLGLFKDEKIICDPSILHIVLNSVLQTQYVIESVYSYLGGNI